MLAWLSSLRPLLARLALPGAEVTVVLGNMAADLDSGVSSLVLAYHRANIKGVNDMSRNTMLNECTAFNCALFLSFHSLKSRHYYK